MIVSVAMITVREGHQGQTVDILNQYVTKEKKVKGCIKAYYKQAINSNDTYLIYIEYDTLESFQAAEKSAHQPEDGKVEFILRPHILKAFYGNFN